MAVPSPELGGRAALAMLGLPFHPHPHLRSRRSMRGTWRGGPGERARALAAFDRARRGAHSDGAPGEPLRLRVTPAERQRLGEFAMRQGFPSGPQC